MTNELAPEVLDLRLVPLCSLRFEDLESQLGMLISNLISGIIHSVQSIVLGLRRVYLVNAQRLGKDQSELKCADLGKILPEVLRVVLSEEQDYLRYET